ncbi:MAG: dCTP deaminase [Candidatus Micrarchaeaceae archaeon]
MSILSKKSILKLLNEGDIVIHPYDEKKVNNCSVDITLGNYYFRQSNETEIDVNKNQRLWNDKPIYEENIIYLKPGELILATSNEFIGSRKKCTTMLKSKSTTTRWGLDVCASGGYGDIGYINRWAFPLHNRTNKIVNIKPGTRIAQIVFFYVTEDEDSYTLNGNYQKTDNLEELISTWKPESVLPKAMS